MLMAGKKRNVSEGVTELALPFVAFGDLEGLQKVVPVDFDWGSVCGALLLHGAMEAGFRAKTDSMPCFHRMVEWMVEQGADPHVEVPHAHTEVPDPAGSIKVIEGTQTATSLALEFFKMSKGHRDCTSYLRQLLPVLAGCSKVKRQKVAIDRTTLERWEGIRNKVDTHNVSFEAADGKVTAHDVVLLVASPVLAAMLGSAMEEGTSNCIQVKDSSADAVSLFLDMVYMSATASDFNYKAVLGALDLSHRWEVPSIVRIFEDLLQDMITSSSFAEIAESAALKGLDGLKEACIKFARTSSDVQASVTWGVD